jgi:TonB family protein
LLGVAACGFEGDETRGQPLDETEPGFEPPVMINPETPVAYPVELYDRQVEASVVLRLFVTEEGVLVPESTRVVESSGYSALDSAAIAGVPAMNFAPARRRGDPVPALFLQPVHFRHPALSGSGELP